MKIGLLIIASEVLDGKITDLNTFYLTEYLRRHHFELKASLAVRDTDEEIKNGLDYMLSQCDVVVTSGGLGPTKDDLTKESLGSYFNLTSGYSKEAHDVASENYSRLKRDFPGKEHCYSFLPNGFIPLKNSAGFAPGFFYRTKDKFILSAPGVPREFKAMIEDYFPSHIFNHFPTLGFIEAVNIRTKRVPEEKIFGEVDPSLWDKLSNIGEVSSLPIILGVDIGIKIKALSEIELASKKESVLKIIENSPVKPHVWHIGHESVEKVIVDLGIKKKFTFGFAESATGGLCSSRITNVAGSSTPFFGSVVCYDTSVKENVLRVSSKTIDEHTAVSEITAKEMASGIAKLLQVDFGIAITGYAGPGGGTLTEPVGTVYIGCFARGQVSAERYQFTGDREQLKNRFAQMALMTLLQEMEKLA